jgi:hypothetical protein
MANDLRPFFDARRLNEQELGMIEFVLTSPAYEMAFKPYLQSVRDSMHALWLDRSQRRKDDYPDDFLAGGVCAIEGLLKFFAATLTETNFDRIHDSMAQMIPERNYELLRQAGKIRPVVGADQRAEPVEYKPEEDF